MPRTYYRIESKKKVYYIDYFVNGKRVRESVGTNKDLADRILRDRLNKIDEGKHPDVKLNKKILFKDFSEIYRKTHAEPNKKSYSKTDRYMIDRFNDYFGDKCLYEITPKMIEEYKLACKQKKSRNKRLFSNASVNKELNLLKSIFSKAILWNMAVDNPVKKVSLFKLDNYRLRYLETEEIQKLIVACNYPLRQIVVVALNTGMRKGEIQNLLWTDINFNDGFIALHETKNGESRYVPMNQMVKNAFLAVRKSSTTPYVFHGKDGIPFNFRKSFQSALDRAKIKNFRFHDLRHTAASHMVMAGVDLNTVREILGHKTIEMTLRYSHLSQSHRFKAVELLQEKVAYGTNVAQLTENGKLKENAVSVSGLYKTS